MRVAFLTHEPFYPPSGGGSAEAVYLVREMRRRGHEVRLICPAIEDVAGVEREFGIRIHPFETFQMGRYASRRNLKYLLYPFFLKRLALRAIPPGEVDLIFCQHAIASVAGGWLKKQWRVPLVLNFLDHLTAFMETWPAYLAPPFALRRLKAFEVGLPNRTMADAVLAVSVVLGETFAASGYAAERIHPINYGYDAKAFPFRGARGKGNPFVVVMHGSLDQHHLGEVAWNAAAEVCAQRPKTVFRIIGKETPALKLFVARTRALAPSARIETPGFIPYDKIGEELARADLGIIPYAESTGTHCAFVAKVVEYLGVGLPVVSMPLKTIERYFRGEPRIRFARPGGGDFGQQILEWMGGEALGDEAAGRKASERVARELDWSVVCGRAVDVMEHVYARAGR